MAKFDVSIVEKSSRDVVAKWSKVSAKRAGWIVRQWQDKKLKGTSVSVSVSRELSRRLH